MNAVLDTLILGLPVFLGHFGTALLMLIAGIVLYLFVTPINEYHLIKDGNLSAALTRRSHFRHSLTAWGGFRQQH